MEQSILISRLFKILTLSTSENVSDWKKAASWL